MRTALPRPQLLLILVLAVLGIALRFVAIDRSYWFDELATITTTDQTTLHTVIDLTSMDNQPPLYNVSAFAWERLFGFSEIGLRMLSVLFGLLALLTPWLARRSLDLGEKLLIFTTLSLMTLPIRYAQEARNYSLLFLLSSVCLFLYFESFVDRSRRVQIPLYVGLLLLALSHLFGLLLAVCFLAVMFWRERRLTVRIAMAAYAALLSAAVMIPLLHGGSGELAGGKFWIKFTAGSLGVQLLTVLTPVGVLLLAYALAAWRRLPARPALSPALLPSLMPFGLMLLGSIVVSINTPILTDRNLIGIIPAFALLCGCFLRRTFAAQRVWVGSVLLCLLCAQAVILVYSPYLFVQEDFRSIAQQSVKANSKVCYVVPGSNVVPSKVFSFYVVQIFQRPDLMPIIVDSTEVPENLSASGCTLWSTRLQKRGQSLLRTMPQFQQCIDLPLARPPSSMANELLDCTPTPAASRQ